MLHDGLGGAAGSRGRVESLGGLSLALRIQGVVRHETDRRASRRRQGSCSALGCVWTALGIAGFGLLEH